ncbi:MAG: sulfotransferase family 2 domain-containing protein [Pseudomonadota bacterium]
MVISHSHKYLFVELPLTGSTAISKELTLNYGGELILHKHATYREFLRVATDAEKEYFVFSGIRNPMERAISQYEKYYSNHKNRFTDEKKLARRKGFYSSLDKMMDLKRFRFIQEHGDNFPAYLNRFYKIPYDNWSRLDHHRFDFVIQFERLQEDFSEVLSRIGIEQVRALPLVNKTEKKSLEFSDYFTVETKARAVTVFGPFMEKWNYAFPTEWGEVQVSSSQRAWFNFLGFFRRLIWVYLRPKR